MAGRYPRRATGRPRGEFRAVDTPLSRLCRGSTVAPAAGYTEPVDEIFRLHRSRGIEPRLSPKAFGDFASDRFGPRVGAPDKTRPSTCSRRRLLAILDSE